MWRKEPEHTEAEEQTERQWLMDSTEVIRRDENQTDDREGGAGKEPHSLLEGLQGVRGAIPAGAVDGRNGLVYGESNGTGKGGEATRRCLGATGQRGGAVRGRRGKRGSIVESSRHLFTAYA
jgi:hypothetical protein